MPVSTTRRNESSSATSSVRNASWGTSVLTSSSPWWCPTTSLPGSTGTWASPRPSSIISTSRSLCRSIYLRRHPWCRCQARGIVNDQNGRGGAIPPLPFAHARSETTNKEGTPMEIFGVVVVFLVCALALWYMNSPGDWVWSHESCRGHSANEQNAWCFPTAWV